MSPSAAIDPLAPWPVERVRRVLNGGRWCQVDREEVRLPGGALARDFYRVHLGAYAIVVPFDDTGDLVLLRAYRHGARAVLTEVPGGLIDPGESPRAAAERELEEETGYRAGEWWALAPGLITDPNRDCGTGHLFVARGLTRVGPGEPTAALLTLSAVAFLEAVATGAVASTLPTVAAVSLAQRVAWRRLRRG